MTFDNFVTHQSNAGCFGSKLPTSLKLNVTKEWVRSGGFSATPCYPLKLIHYYACVLSEQVSGHQSKAGNLLKSITEVSQLLVLGSPFLCGNSNLE